MNLDKVLLELENHGLDNFVKAVPGKDIKVLKSLAGIVKSSTFLTANQGRLLEKVLNENKDVLSTATDHLIPSLENVTWSKNFRVIDYVRRLFVGTDPYGEPIMTVEFSPHSQIRKVATEVFKSLPDGYHITGQKSYVAPLTEKNLVLAIEKLSQWNFDIDEKLKNQYETIKSWNFNNFKEMFTIGSITKNNLVENLIKDIGPLDTADQNLILDRQCRFNYFTKNQKNPEKSLKNTIVNRTSANVWIDSTEISLEELIKELHDLKRLPILFVLDGNTSKVAIESLKKLEKSLKKLEILDNVGIHFRLDNNSGKEFNEIISKNQYNAKLTEQSLYVGVAHQKLPKFFLKSPWYPMSVVSIDTRLRHSKTAVYANSCDLIIEYTATKSIMENKNPWLQ